MSAITQFLLDRIAEEQAVAQAATENRYRYEAQDDAWAWSDLVLNSERDTSEVHDDFIATWHPQRALVECAAKRAIVEAHTWEASDEGNGTVASTDCIDCWQPPPCATIRAILTIYKDHPDAPDPRNQL